MTEIASRELRNNTRGLLRRVSEGESIVITVDGQPVATLQPLAKRPRWISGAEFARLFAGHQSDPGLREEIRSLAPDTTDDLPW
jgi:prevent-host-death family protein